MGRRDRHQGCPCTADCSFKGLRAHSLSPLELSPLCSNSGPLSVQHTLIAKKSKSTLSADRKGSANRKLSLLYSALVRYTWRAITSSGLPIQESCEHTRARQAQGHKVSTFHRSSGRVNQGCFVSKREGTRGTLGAYLNNW